MKRIILLLVFINLVMDISAQDAERLPDPDPMNSINVDLLGNATLIGISYERIIKTSKNSFLAGKLGVGYGKELLLDYYDTLVTKFPVYLSLPHQVTFNIGKKRHFIEAGIGGTITIGDVSPHYVPYITVGYRLQPLYAGNIKFRIYGNFLPFNTKNFRNIYFVPFGLSLGLCL
jgi:hypothetical protein